MHSRRMVGLLMLLLSVSCLAYAATEVTVDWQTGEVEVLKEETPKQQKPQQEANAQLATCKKNILRLQRIIKTQQTIILQQQKKLQEQQVVIRRQGDVIRGLDLLRRQGK
ncbi:MAG: hypothetical protein PWP34_95 [Desulfuromonadales bacterium]|nr:hypothetical protein [Desulfuromonadales bacterium]